MLSTSFQKHTGIEGMGCGDHQLADLVHDFLAALVEGVHGTTQRPRLDLPGIHRQVGLPITKPVQMSVPPLPEATHRSFFTLL